MRTRLDPIGFTYHGNILCHDCGASLPETDPEGNVKHPIAPWDEFTWLDDEGNWQPFPCEDCGEDIQ